MILFTQWYITNEARQREIDHCFRTNLANPYIDTIFLLLEKDINFEHPKLKKKIIGQRMKYIHAIQEANISCTNQICAIANADVYFDDSIKILTKEAIQGKFLTLSRWNKVSNEYVICPIAACSQDAWVFLSPIPEMYSDIPLGHPGCDNRIAFEANKVGLKVINPSLEIIIRHVHAGDDRSYYGPRINGATLHVSITSLFDADLQKMPLKRPL